VSTRAETGYGTFVRCVWDRIEERTGYEPFYLDARTIASYCPACREGTLRLGFVSTPRPGFAVLSGPQRDPDLSAEYWIEAERLDHLIGEDPSRGTCSRGCTEREIAEALF